MNAEVSDKATLPIGQKIWEGVCRFSRDSKLQHQTKCVISHISHFVNNNRNPLLGVTVLAVGLVFIACVKNAYDKSKKRQKDAEQQKQAQREKEELKAEAKKRKALLEQQAKSQAEQNGKAAEKEQEAEQRRLAQQLKAQVAVALSPAAAASDDDSFVIVPVQSIKPIQAEQLFTDFLERKLLNDLHASLLHTHNDLRIHFHEDSLQVRLIANIFGSGIFENKLYQGRRIDGPGSTNAIWEYFSALVDYRNLMVENTPFKNQLKTIQAFDEIFEAYLIFYISALLRLKIKDPSTTSKTKTKLHKLQLQLIKMEINAVKEQKKSRFYWLGGSSDHFVPFEFYWHPQHNFTVGFFNLGGILDRNNQVGNEFQSETLIRRSMINTDEKLGEFFTGLIDTTRKNYLDWQNFIAPYKKYIYPPGKAAKELNAKELDESILLQTQPHIREPQQMGDCTCKGNWALLEAEFRRLFSIPQVSFLGFKSFLYQREIDKLNKLNKLKMKKAPNSSSKDISLEEITSECVRMASKPRKIKFSLYGYSFALPLDELFDANTKTVRFGRWPEAKEVGVKCYRLNWENVLPKDSSHTDTAQGSISRHSVVMQKTERNGEITYSFEIPQMGGALVHRTRKGCEVEESKPKTSIVVEPGMLLEFPNVVQFYVEVEYGI